MKTIAEENGSKVNMRMPDCLNSTLRSIFVISRLDAKLDLAMDA